jgi:hypothetical protein
MLTRNGVAGISRQAELGGLPRFGLNGVVRPMRGNPPRFVWLTPRENQHDD